MATAKVFPFPLSVRWLDGRRVEASLEGRPALEVATPAEFKGGVVGRWTPEDLLVASAATCWQLTFLALADRRGIPVRALELDAVGEVTTREDRRFTFTGIDLDVRIETEPGQVDAARAAAEEAEPLCIVGIVLDLPVRVRIEVATRESALAG